MEPRDPTLTIPATASSSSPLCVNALFADFRGEFRKNAIGPRPERPDQRRRGDRPLSGSVNKKK